MDVRIPETPPPPCPQIYYPPPPLRADGFYEQPLTPISSNKLKYSLKIGRFNARSLCNKIALVTELIHENNIDLLCVTKTWLKVKDKAKIRELHELGFDIFSAPRAGRGGGVGFIFKSGFPITNQKALKFKSFEVTEAVILAQERIKICLTEVESSRTHFEVLGLGLGLEGQVLGLGLEASSPRKLACPRLEDSTIF